MSLWPAAAVRLANQGSRICPSMTNLPLMSALPAGPTSPVHFEIPSLRVLARHAMPHLIEATILPFAFFYAALWIGGVWWALAAALAWSYAAVGWRIATGRRLPGVLVLGTLGLSARTVLAVLSGSVFVYFLQPTLGTAATAAAFLISVPAGRPLTQRLAADFCPFPEGFTSHPRIRAFFLRISLLWGMIYLVNAAMTLWLLVSQSLEVFLLVKTVGSWILTGGAIAISTAWFRACLRTHDPEPQRAEVPQDVPALAFAPASA